MEKARWVKGIGSMLIVGSIMFVAPSSVFARGEAHRDDGQRHHYSNRVFYPQNSISFAIGGVKFLLSDGAFYRNNIVRYTVVTPPRETVVVSAPVTIIKAQDMRLSNTVEITFPNSDGTFTTVVLEKTAQGYLGPQGEYYFGKPSVEQLRVLYGR